MVLLIINLVEWCVYSLLMDVCPSIFVCQGVHIKELCVAICLYPAFVIIVLDNYSPNQCSQDKCLCMQLGMNDLNDGFHVGLRPIVGNQTRYAAQSQTPHQAKLLLHDPFSDRCPSVLPLSHFSLPFHFFLLPSFSQKL